MVPGSLAFRRSAPPDGETPGASPIQDKPARRKNLLFESTRKSICRFHRQARANATGERNFTAVCVRYRTYSCQCICYGCCLTFNLRPISSRQQAVGLLCRYGNF